MSSHHGMEDLKGIEAFCYRVHGEQEGNRFGRLFPHLPPLYTPPASLVALGDPGPSGGPPGPMNGGTTTNRTNAVNGVTVGQVFFGQFIDHDITLDLSSSLEATANVRSVTNTRTPTLDLDSIYGLGPEASSYLYFNDDSSDFHQAKLVTGADGTAVNQPPPLAADDLCRTGHGTAIIGDFRNDENRIISQLHLGIIKFHNHICDQLHTQHGGALKHKALYDEARRLTTWHYQWVVATDFLVQMCGLPVVTDILGGGRHFYCADPYEAPFIPVEFSVAAYRFGHSMVPQQLQLQSGGPSLDLFGPTLREGFKPVQSPQEVVAWPELVESPVPGGVQRAEKLDTQLAATLLDLPFITEGPKSLATRNLLRGQVFLLPSGESVARAMAGPLGLTDADIDAVSSAAQSKAGSGIDLSRGTPLWYYILVEAEEVGRETTRNHFDPGEGLGPLGARIVAETILGLIELDERSFLGSNRNWDPISDGIGVTTLGEMLTYP